jgi:glycosyltransferase involved in cell wall biosynthesis
MKILHVVSSVNPAGGGPIEGIKQLGTALASKGHQVEIASLDFADAPFLKRCPLPVHPLGPSSLKYAFSSKFLPWLRGNRHSYDAVIVNGIWQYHSFATWKVLHKSSTPYVVFTHGMLDPWFKKQYPLKHIKKWMYWPWAEYRVLRDAAAVLFTCEEERVLARTSFWLYRCNERVVNYGTSKPKGDQELEREEFFRHYPELRGKKLALFLGRIHPKKGCDLLIEAFARVLANDSNWHLVMAGPDQIGWQKALDFRAAELGISSQITWTGMLNGSIKWAALRSSEIFILPSHQENFGIAVVEALAAGTPALISNKVNIWREIQLDGAGLVAKDTLESTCEMLRDYVQMPLRKKIAMRGATTKCFEERFEIENAAESLVAVLGAVTGATLHHECN